MSASYRAALVSFLLLAGCSGSTQVAPSAESAEQAEATDFDAFQTPRAEPAAASTDQRVASDSAPADEPAAAAPEGPLAAPAPSGTAADGGAGKPASSAAAADPPAPAAEAPGTAEISDEPLPPRETLAGRWEFLLCQFGADYLGMLIEIKSEGDEYTATLLDNGLAMPDWTLASEEVTEKTASINFLDNGIPIHFEGSLQEDGVVRGNVMLGEEGPEPVRLVATNRDSLEDADPQVPSEDVEKMQGFQPDPDNALAQLREKLTDLGDSALAYELARRLSAVVRGQRPPEEEYKGFPEQYLAAAEPWGKRIVDRAHLDIAYTMALCGYSRDEADKHLAVVEEGLADNASDAVRQRVTTARGLLDLQSDDEGRQQAAMEALQQLRSKNPFDTNVTLGLAAFHERNQHPEQALELYAELAALPTGAGDMEPVERLWNELGREPAELSAFLDRIYKERVHQFAEAQSDAPRAEGRQHTILGELFTGAMCPPCVAADVATGGLEVTYPSSDFIMLRYHQHVPGPDPLTIQAGEERAAGYYRIQGTPSLFFNGQPIQVQNMYGSITNAALGYGELRQIIDQLLTQSSDLNIKLEASAADGVMSISAAVEGVEEFPETWRLRLALAEDEIFYDAQNGVRLHEMVVRAMPGGAEGTGPTDGQLQYEGTVSLDELREEIAGYISQIPGLQVPPAELAPLHVVAFVQDDTNRRILQATAIPVAGLTQNAGGPAPATPRESEGEPKTGDEEPAIDKSEADTTDAAAGEKPEAATPDPGESDAEPPSDSPAPNSESTES